MAVAPIPAAEGDGGAPGAQLQEPEPEQRGSAGAADESACAGQLVTLEEAKAGRVKPGVSISIAGLVASSQKFLLSEAKSGSCLWGAFAADERRTGAGSGLLLVSFGPAHEGSEPCAAGHDGLPDDLAPGDRLTAPGVLDDFAPSGCDGVAPSQQLRIDPACPLQRHGSAEPPVAAPIDVALADRLAAGVDAALLREWSGALVSLDGASALEDSDDGDAVFPFGVIRLRETALEVHSRLYYFDLTGGGPKATGKAPGFGYPTQFERLTGLVFLDYCSWVLAPRDRCSDLSPASRGC
jgi:hypothetical protein